MLFFSILSNFAVVCLCTPSGQRTSAHYYKNPVVSDNCPDPGVLFDEKLGLYVAVSTSNYNDVSSPLFPIRVSEDLIHWQQKGYAFDAANGRPPVGNTLRNYWAPEIAYIPATDKYNIYFTATDARTGLLCIWVAAGNSSLGPFEDARNGEALVSGDEDTGVGYIDAHFFNAGYFQHLLYKYDGNDAVPKRLPTPILARVLNNDGLSFIDGSSDVEMIRNDRNWESTLDFNGEDNSLVEAPWIIAANGYYYMFYSATWFDQPTYGVSVARTRASEGSLSSALSLPFDWQKMEGPILHTKWRCPYCTQGSAAFAGPGHCSVVKAPNGSDAEYVMIYHAWDAANVGEPNPRFLMADAIVFDDDNWPRIAGNSPSQIWTHF